MPRVLIATVASIVVLGPLFQTVGFPPVGINDLAFDRTSKSLYATNTGDSRVLRIPLLANGDAGTVQIFADGAAIDGTPHEVLVGRAETDGVRRAPPPGG